MEALQVVVGWFILEEDLEIMKAQETAWRLRHTAVVHSVERAQSQSRKDLPGHTE